MTQVLWQGCQQLHTHPPSTREVMTADPQKVAHLPSEELVLQAAHLGADRCLGEDFAELWVKPR